MERQSNYEIAKYRTAELFLGYDQEKMIQKFDLEHDDEYLYIVFFSRKYRISRKTGICDWLAEDGTWVEGEFNASMTIYDVLGYSKEHCHLSGTFSKVTSLNGMNRVTMKPGDGLSSRVEAFFDKHPSELDQALQKIGGKKEGKGDVAYRLEVFPFFPCLFQFYCADEDFPAQLTILWDSNTLEFMHFETVFYAAGFLHELLIDMIKEELSEE